MSRLAAATTALLFAFSACSDVSPSPPQLSAVSPARVSAASSRSVTVTGANLFRRYSVDFNAPQNSAQVGGLTVTLERGPQRVDTQLIAHVSESELVVQIPAGLEAGMYDVTVRDPWSREDRLVGGLRVLLPCEAETGPLVGDACDGSDEDLCPDDAFVCTGAVLTCSTGSSNAELCDGEDNDCDATTPDGFAEPGFAQPCDGADSDLCEDDTRVCSASGMACSLGEDTFDLCDAQDNDCNPTTPDGAHEPTLGASCEGDDADRCTDDQTVCTAGVLGCSVGANNPELCDGNDNDCDEATADGVDAPDFNGPCDGDDGDLCLDDVRFCSATGMACSSGVTELDLCDGENNDCDASTADGVHEPDFNDACDSDDDTDLCEEDVRTCGGLSGMRCESVGPSATDVCDTVDNDCNEATENGSADPLYNQPCDSTADVDTCADGVWICNGTGMVCNDEETTVGCTVPLAVDVGTFSQAPNAANVQVVPHSLGDMPKLLILWTTGSDGASNGYTASLGVVDQNRVARAHAASRPSTSATGRAIANKALVIASSTGAVVAEASVTGWTTTNFTLTWNTNAASTRVFQFLIASGSDVKSVLKAWQMRTTVGTSTQTGLGFNPTAVIHLSSGYSFNVAPPAGLSTAHMAIAATDGTGQFTAGFKSLSGVPTDTSRAMRNSRCFIGWLGDLSYDFQASCTGLFGTGSFGVNFDDPPPNAGHVSSLAVTGMRVKTACFAKPLTAAPFNLDVTGVGFQPLAVLFATNNTELALGPVNLASFAIGASTVSEDFGSSLIDADAANPQASASWANGSSSYLRYNTDFTLISAAEVSAALADGFRLRFTLNSASDADICYLAIGAP